MLSQLAEPRHKMETFKKHNLKNRQDLNKYIRALRELQSKLLLINKSNWLKKITYLIIYLILWILFMDLWGKLYDGIF